MNISKWHHIVSSVLTYFQKITKDADSNSDLYKTTEPFLCNPSHNADADVKDIFLSVQRKETDFSLTLLCSLSYIYFM